MPDQQVVWAEALIDGRVKLVIEDVLPLQKKNSSHWRSIELGNEHRYPIPLSEDFMQILEEGEWLRQKPVLVFPSVSVHAVEDPRVFHAPSLPDKDAALTGVAYILTCLRGQSGPHFILRAVQVDSMPLSPFIERKSTILV